MLQAIRVMVALGGDDLATASLVIDQSLREPTLGTMSSISDINIISSSSLSRAHSMLALH